MYFEIFSNIERIHFQSQISIFIETPPKLSRNYILVPVILCLGSWLMFYNYD
jgi:hypothetical protein